MLNFIRALSVMACALLFHANAQALEILIDDFSEDQALLQDNVVDGTGASSQVNDGGAGTILGGYRDIYVEEIDNGVASQPDSAVFGIRAGVSGGRFVAVLDDLVKAYAVVTYDGSNNVGSGWDVEGAGGVDTGGLGGISFAGIAGFLFEEVSNDLVAPAQLIIWTDDNDDGNYVKHILDFVTFGDINDGDVYDAFISADGFSDFENINWEKVGAFQAIFNLSNDGDTLLNVDLSLSRATVVPEPAALSMLGAGMLMLGFVGYRRRKNQ